MPDQEERRNAEDDTYGRRREDGIQIGYGKWKLQANGSVVTILVCLAMMVAVVVYEVETTNKASNDHLDANFRIITSNQKMLADKQDQVIHSQDETTYVLTLSQEDRQKLHLDMPESLRRKAGR